MNLEEVDNNDLIAAKTELEDLISWSDELPAKLVIGRGRYKCRNNWFQGVLSNILAIADILGDRELEVAANDLGEEIRTKGNERTTSDQINRADQLIRSALEKLQNIS